MKRRWFQFPKSTYTLKKAAFLPVLWGKLQTAEYA